MNTTNARPERLDGTILAGGDLIPLRRGIVYVALIGWFDGPLPPARATVAFPLGRRLSVPELQRLIGSAA